MIRLADKVISWLLEKENPSVRFFTLSSLLDKPDDDIEVVEAKKAIMEYGTVPEILALQNDDGSWGVPEMFYRDKYGGTVWTLLILAELGADSYDPRIIKACEFVLKHSQEPESGGFSFCESVKTGRGFPSGIVPCLTGNMVFTLIKFEYLNDERLTKAIDWIVKYQRTDDGIENAPSGGPYEKYAMCWRKHSCHMGVAKALKAFAAIPPENRSEAVNNKINEMAEYFLKHHIYKKSHNLSEISRPGWLKPGFPLMYQTDILELLEIFASLKIRDERLKDAIDIVKSKRTVDGTWKMENSNNGKMVVRIENKGKPSKWITLKALKVLKEYE